MRICAPEIKRRLAHPSTADFSWITGSTFKPDGNGALIAVRLTAKNSFGLEVGMIGACTFSAGTVTDVSVEEDRG